MLLKRWLNIHLMQNTIKKKVQEEISSPKQCVVLMFLKEEGVMRVIEAIASSACCSSVFSNLHLKKTASNFLPKMESVVKSTTVVVLGESIVHDALFQCGQILRTFKN